MFEKNNVIEIRKKILIDLKTLISNVYYEDSPAETADYPFLVFELVDSQADGASTEIFDLYINGWDDSTDTTALETLMFDANNLIDQKVYNVDGSTLSFRPVLERKQNLNDSESRLKRREYRYLVRTIQRRI